MRLSELPYKIKAKVVNFLSTRVPVNTRYSPRGIVTLKNRDKIQGVSYHLIEPPYLSELVLPGDLIPHFSEDTKPRRYVRYPAMFVVTLEGGRIYNLDSSNIAVMTRENFFIDDVSFQWRRRARRIPSNENAIFNRKMFPPPVKYPGTVFSLLSGGGAIDYYYHWVIDSISKLYLLRESGLHDQVDYYLVPSYKHKFQKEFLEHFGIEESKVIDANDVRHIEADRIIATSDIRVMEHLPAWVPEFLYTSFFSRGGSEGTKLIYISRTDAEVNRKVLNEDDVIQILKPLGFEICVLSQLSIRDQAKLFNSARLVVASHGGGLTNLVFCNSGTKVLEIFPRSYVSHLFWDIAMKKGLKYEYMVCRSSGDEGEPARLDVTVDLSLLEQKVNALLG